MMETFKSNWSDSLRSPGSDNNFCVDLTVSYPLCPRPMGSILSIHSKHGHYLCLFQRDTISFLHHPLNPLLLLLSPHWNPSSDPNPHHNHKSPMEQSQISDVVYVQTIHTFCGSLRGSDWICPFRKSSSSSISSRFPSSSSLAASSTMDSSEFGSFSLDSLESLD